jgi:thiamine biosynthesis lipoprotein
LPKFFQTESLKKITMKKFGLLIFTALLLTSCSDLQFQKLEGGALGTYYAITYKGKENLKLQFGVDSILKSIDETFSIFNPTSITSKINNNQEITINNDFVEVFKIALHIAKETDGALDITIGPLVNLWGFGKDERKADISQAEIDSVMTLIGWWKVCRDGNSILKQNPDIQLNFNALAKGYAVDKVADYLVAQGYKDCVVDIGGEIVAKGKKYHDQEWNIGLQTPTRTRDGEMRAEESFHLRDRAVATSGNYRNYFEENGQRFTHIIDPKTGRPEKSNLLSVTVIADQCVMADAYATAFMVMGKEKTKGFLANHPELTCIFISDNQGQYQTEVCNPIDTNN